MLLATATIRVSAQPEALTSCFHTVRAMLGNCKLLVGTHYWLLGTLLREGGSVGSASALL